MDLTREVFELVFASYSRFDADNEEGRQQLAAIRQHLRNWFETSPRYVSNTALYCMTRFVQEETDPRAKSQTPQELRDIHIDASFGKRHVSRLAGRSRADLTELSRLFLLHVVCGYLFSEFGYGHTARLAKRAPQDLYDIWLGLCLSKVLTQLDPKSKDEENIQGIWMTCTAQPIVNLTEPWGNRWEPTDNWILTRCFYAGRLLRWLEAIRLTDDELRQFYAAAC